MRICGLETGWASTPVAPASMSVQVPLEWGESQAAPAVKKGRPTGGHADSRKRAMDEVAGASCSDVYTIVKDGCRCGRCMALLQEGM